MKQSRAASLIEAIVNIGVGFGLAIACQAIVLPALGVDIPWRAKETFKAGIVMDDKIITIEMPWTTIRSANETGLAEYILNQMRGPRCRQLSQTQLNE